MHQVEPSKGSASKYPEWVVLIVTADGEGRANVMPAGWAMYVSTEPLLFAVAVNRKQHTNKLIKETGQFVISVPAPGMEEVIRYCGSHSGRDVDKVAACGIATLPASRVKPPLLAGARANLECVLAQAVEAGDHTVLIGEIVAAWEGDDAPGRLMNWGDGLFALAAPVS
ncbi:MAG: flavin reductase family protein [Chloroflexi bacterium]|nr:flavin reductase family protein [Chloroflexota bacterium]